MMFFPHLRIMAFRYIFTGTTGRVPAQLIVKGNLLRFENIRGLKMSRKVNIAQLPINLCNGVQILTQQFICHGPICKMMIQFPFKLNEFET
jgi:hypothetical protein